MSNFNNFGGLHLKFSGKSTKDQIMEKISNMLDMISNETDLDCYSNVNFYTQIYNKENERIAFVSHSGKILKGFEVKNDSSTLSISENGFTPKTVKSINEGADQYRKELEQRRKMREASDRLIAEAKRKERQREEDEIKAFRDAFCSEFNVKKPSDIASSTAKVISRNAILKYIPEGDIPDCGYVFRASIKNPQTGKVEKIIIYNEKFDRIFEVNK